MKKEALTHFVSLVIFFAVITLYRKWFTDLSYLLFWLGGAVGTLLPDLDHLFYTLLLRPFELTSQRLVSTLKERKFIGALDLLYRSRYERTLPIFHTSAFQILFIVFAFLVISSSGSLFGRGLALAFMLHLLVDQFKEHLERENIDRWFQGIPIQLDSQIVVFYLLINLIILIFFGLFF